jgi:hypothetical protein
MGWKWDDIRVLLAATGMFTDEQLDKIDEVVKGKKKELADTLGLLARQAEDEARRAKDIGAAGLANGRADAFREVRDAVKP